MVSSTTTALGEIGTGIYGSVGDGGQKFASITVAAGQSAELVADSTNDRIRVLALVLTQIGSSSTSTAKFHSNDDSATETDLTGLLGTKVQSDMVLVLPFNPAGWFQTEVDGSLNITTTNAAAAGFLVYELVAGT